jgi:hypothetical protein
MRCCSGTLPCLVLHTACDKARCTAGVQHTPLLTSGGGQLPLPARWYSLTKGDFRRILLRRSVLDAQRETKTKRALASLLPAARSAMRMAKSAVVVHVPRPKAPAKSRSAQRCARHLYATATAVEAIFLVFVGRFFLYHISHLITSYITYTACGVQGAGSREVRRVKFMLVPACCVFSCAPLGWSLVPPLP